MKKLIFIITLILLSTAVFASVSAFDIDWGSQATYGPSRANTLRQWAEGIEGRLGGIAATGTGNIYYVDSGVTNEGDGSSWENARNTLDEAIGLCTDNNGDVIYVAQGHAEDWSSADSADIDVAGITIIGCGTGTDRPTFTFDGTAAELVVGAANTYVYNLAFLPSVAQVVHAIEIEADADGSVIDNCWFMDGETAATDEFKDTIQWTAASDNITVINCVFESYSSTATDVANAGCDLTAGVVKETKIINNYFYGHYSDAPIFSDDIDLRSLIANNTIINIATGQYAIEFSTTATGSIINNYCASDTPGTIIDPGSMEQAGNQEVDYGAAEDADGGPAWALAKTRPANNYPANVENDSLMAMLMVMDNTGVATIGDYDNDTMSLEALNVDLDALITAIALVPQSGGSTSWNSTALGAIEGEATDAIEADSLDKLIAADDSTGATAYPDSVAQDSILAYIMASDSSPVATGYNNTTDSLEAIADRDVSILSYLANGTPATITTPGTNLTILDILGGNGTTTTSASAASILGAVGTNELPADTPFSSSTTQYDADGSVLERLELLQNYILVQQAYGNATSGYAHPVAYWFVDGNIGASGDGKTLATAFKTIDDAITACSNSVEDFILVWDYSGSAATITINKSWVHLIGMNGSTHPYPRIKATTGHGITLSNGAGRIEICGFTIGGQSTKAGIGLDTGTASQVYIHDCHFGIDSSSLCQEGINIANGCDAVDLVVENCEFKTAITQEGIEIAGNATWGRIRNNLFIGLTASDSYPAINLSGSVVGIAVEGNRIAGGGDDGAGWGISLSAGSSECWVNDNYANDNKDAVSQNPYEDGAANAWGLNYKDKTATLP